MSNSPNIHILTNELLSRWRHLLGEVASAELAQISPETIQGMERLHNKIALTALTQEKYLLAVTGLQGAGKTSLVKRLYNLDHTFLQDNEGRGEKLPILITESNITSPEGYVCRSFFSKESGFEIETVKVTADDFNRIAKNPTPKEVWLELKVPQRYFFDEQKSLILLPGFERDTSELSQQLLEHVLHLSTSSIVVFRKDTFARANNVDMVKKVQTIFGNVKPIYVLTHGDVNSENNEIIKQQMIDMIHLPPEDVDRIIMSGDPQKFTDTWIADLAEAIATYAYLTDESETKKLNVLEKLFMDIREEINSLETLLREQEELEIAASQQSNGKNAFNVLNQFEVMYERTLTELERDILESLEGRKGDAVTQFNKYLKENIRTWKGLASRFSTNALAKQEKLEQAIKDAWLNANKVKPEITIINTTTSYIEEQGRKLKDTSFVNSSIVPPSSEKKSFYKIDGLDEGISEEKIAQVNRADTSKMTSLTRINAFFSKEEDPGEIVPILREDLKTLTLMGAMLCRQALYEKELWDENASELVSQETGETYKLEDLNINALNKTIDGVTEFSDKMSELSPMILKSIPLILGIDVALDGEADLVLNVTKALTGLGLTITPLQLLGVIGTAITIVYSVNAIQQAVHDTNQRQLELSYAGRNTIDKLPEIQTKAYIRALRRVYEKMYDQLAEIHMEKIGIFDNDAKLEKIRYSLRRIKQLNSEIQKMVYRRERVII